MASELTLTLRRSNDEGKSEAKQSDAASLFLAVIFELTSRPSPLVEALRLPQHQTLPFYALCLLEHLSDVLPEKNERKDGSQLRSFRYQRRV